MGIDIRLPNINDPTEKGQLVQIKSYLRQLAEQLQWAMQNIDTSNNTVIVNPISRSASVSSGAGTKEVDVVVAEGSEGIWYYRKWLSGRAECWGRIRASLNISTQWGSVYYDSVEGTAFPSGLFKSAPMCQVTPEYGGSMQVAWMAVGGKATQSATPGVWFCRPTTGEASIDILYYAMGDWK